MARIRTVKPEFWRHEELSALPEATHLLAAALLNYSDDYGYFNANPKLIQAECSPLREPSVSIPESLRSLQTAGYVRIGTGSDGKRYGHIVNFSEHQRVSHPTVSKIAALSITWDTNSATPENLRNPPEDFGPERKGKERNREGASAPPPDVHRETSGDDDTSTIGQQAARVFAHWQRVHGKPRAKLDAKRRKLIRTALATYSEADLCLAIDGYKNSPFHMGQNDSKTVHDGIGLMLRDAEHIDAGIRYADRRPLGNPLDPTAHIEMH